MSARESPRWKEKFPKRKGKKKENENEKTNRNEPKREGYSNKVTQREVVFPTAELAHQASAPGQAAARPRPRAGRARREYIAPSAGSNAKRDSCDLVLWLLPPADSIVSVQPVPAVRPVQPYVLRPVETAVSTATKFLV